tara:strand:+ start:9 stop:443 length:435 start_codon:yes stop_codon:yes gene_type:complete
MKFFKQIVFFSLISIILWSCGASPVISSSTQKEEPVVIANDSLEYEITIIDPGFTYFLNAVAQPEGFYSQDYMESINRAWVNTWNQRARNTIRFNPNIYENIIDYQSTINYGYEVNYKLFNYFLFAQRKYKMSLGGGFRTNRIN